MRAFRAVLCKSIWRGLTVQRPHTPFVVFRAILCLSTALMMAISWPLWVTAGSFPRVPWLGWVRLLPEWASWVRFMAASIGLLVAATPNETTPRWPMAGLLVSLLLSAWIVLEDQFRLQPWTYQFLLMGYVIAAVPPRKAATLCRWMFVAIYLHSGLSKLDRNFISGTGPMLVGGFRKAAGLSGWDWPRVVWEVLPVLMPCWEIGIASALATRMWRVGAIGAAILHVSLLLILGPWGLDHSGNVLIWNAALMVEVSLLFVPRGDATVSTVIPRSKSKTAERIAVALTVIACLIPLTERLGWWDTWPSFGLYASSNEMSGLWATPIDGAGAGWTIPLRRDPMMPWSDQEKGGRVVEMYLDLREWSLRERRVPLYPSNRAMNGVAEAVAARAGLGITVRTWHWTRADARTGQRDCINLEGLDAIRRFGDTFWLNAHPAR